MSDSGRPKRPGKKKREGEVNGGGNVFAPRIISLSSSGYPMPSALSLSLALERLSDFLSPYFSLSPNRLRISVVSRLF